MYVIFMGAQGSGKGTQAERIGPTLKLVKVATGDLFRSAIAQQSELGLKVQSIIESGNLVPDELTNAIVQVRLAQIAANRLKDDDVDGALFDGFPRTEAQARALDDILASQDTKLDAVIEIDVPREKLIARLAGRRTCEACGAVYHVESDPPKVEGICDKCGGKLIQREDDKPDSIARRLALYDNQTRPLLDYYRAKGILITINGDQDIDTVTADILNALGQA
ncbi:MAG: adenylate kinase [Thermomicrobiales bacterium]|nr:adenylate kinase [Thermomicrobiales bacterium]MCO5229121.1 adenylate kinase [Thermomicrobiales bacterium]